MKAYYLISHKFSKNKYPNRIRQKIGRIGKALGKRLRLFLKMHDFSSLNSNRVYKPEFAGGPPHRFICGEDAKAKQQVSRICKDFGWNSIDVGGMGFSHYLEAAAMI